MRRRCQNLPVLLAAASVRNRFDAYGIDEDGALAAQDFQGILEAGVDGFRDAEKACARHAEAGALERASIEKHRVVRGEPVTAVVRRGISRVDPDEQARHEGDVGHAAGHGAHDVEAHIGRDHTGPADQAHRGLEAHEGAGSRGKPYRRARVAAHGECAEVRGDRGGGAAARAARETIERVGVAHGAPAPAGDAVTAGELVHVGLGEQDGPRFPELFGHPGVPRRHGVHVEIGPVRRAHAVLRIEGVFENDGNAVQRPSRPFLLALAV